MVAQRYGEAVLVVASVLVTALWRVTCAEAATFACAEVACVTAAIRTSTANGEPHNTITLTPGVHPIATPTEVGEEGATAFPPLRSALTIRVSTTEDDEDGSPGPEQAVLARSAAAPLFRFFHVTEEGALTLRGITLDGGAVSRATAQRGGCLLATGPVRLLDTVVTHCEAFSGGGVWTSAPLEVRRSTFTHNRAALAGSLAASGPLTLRNSVLRASEADSYGCLLLVSPEGLESRLEQVTFLGCQARRNRGGALGLFGDARITSSVFAGNTASRGGALVVERGTVTLHRTVCLENEAAAFGGCLAILAGHVVLTRTHILANTVPFGRGGGIHNASATPFDATEVLVEGNTALTHPDCEGLAHLTRTRIGTPGDCAPRP